MVTLLNIKHQVNPHSALLSTLSLTTSSTMSAFLVGYLRFLKAQIRDWIKNLCDLFVFGSGRPVWSARRGLTSLLTQDYEGRDEDITIMPWRGHQTALSAFTNLMRNPSVEEYNTMMLAAERNTWPAVARIRAHCMIERSLDTCVNQLRHRVYQEGEEGREVFGRTPSFYTSRSIVNLSGLSVADRLPGQDAEDDMEAAALATIANAPRVPDTPPFPPTAKHGDTYTSPAPTASIGKKQLSDAEINELLSDVVGPSIPLQRSKSSAPNYATGGESRSLSKTTSMAKFYYKRSGSEEQLLNKLDSDEGKVTGSSGTSSKKRSSDTKVMYAVN